MSARTGASLGIIERTVKYSALFSEIYEKNMQFVHLLAILLTVRVK